MQNILKLEKEKSKNNIFYLRKDIDDLKNKFEEYRKNINQLLFIRKEDTNKIDDLKYKFKDEQKI